MLTRAFYSPDADLLIFDFTVWKLLCTILTADWNTSGNRVLLITISIIFALHLLNSSLLRFAELFLQYLFSKQIFQSASIFCSCFFLAVFCSLHMYIIIMYLCMLLSKVSSLASAVKKKIRRLIIFVSLWHRHTYYSWLMLLLFFHLTQFLCQITVQKSLNLVF